MNRIVPAIIPETFLALKETLERIRPFTREVQVDVVDGVFVPFRSWPYVPKSSPQDIALLTPTFVLEVDLMVMEPEKVIPLYARAGVRKVVVHLESTSDMPRIIRQRKELGFSLGLSILNDSPLSSLHPYMEDIDYVQFMGIKDIGSQGQPFDERVLERIRLLKERFPEMLVSIDGSVNGETVGKLVAAGGDRCVAGSSILRAEDPEAAFHALERAFL